MAENTPKVRSTYFIKRGFQLRYGFTLFLAMITVALIAGWTTFITTWTMLSESVSPPEVIIAMTDIFDKVSVVLIGRMLFGIIAIGILSVFISHKIAGPIYRLEKIAQQISLGDLSMENIKLREGDELTDLARAVEGVTERLRRLMSKYQEMTAKLSDLVSKISTYTEGGKTASSESARLLKELEVVSSQLLHEISYFKTKSKEKPIGNETITHF